MEMQNEIQKQFRDKQEKYVYYLIALCVASIGFSITKTTGESLKLIQIPLALAVISWGLSIYCGLTFMSFVLSTLYANDKLFDIQAGRFPEVGNNKKLIEYAQDLMFDILNNSSDKASRYGKYQDKLFYLGVILYIIWHLLEMYSISI